MKPTPPGSGPISPLFLAHPYLTSSAFTVCFNSDRVKPLHYNTNNVLSCLFQVCPVNERQMNKTSSRTGFTLNFFPLVFNLSLAQTHCVVPPSSIRISVLSLSLFEYVVACSAAIWRFSPAEKWPAILSVVSSFLPSSLRLFLPSFPFGVKRTSTSPEWVRG